MYADGCDDDVMKRKRFPHYWPFVMGINRSHLDSLHKETVTRALLFSLMPNKGLDKQTRRRWFETPGCLSWRHCNVDGYIILLWQIIMAGSLTHIIQGWFNGTGVYHCSGAREVTLKDMGKFRWYHIKLPASPLQWRHNGYEDVSNHQPHHCLLIRLFRQRSKKTWTLRVTGLCVGNSPVTDAISQMTFSNAFSWMKMLEL